MHLYVVIPLVSCVASAMLAAAILARDAHQRANRVAALLVGGVSFWAGCEVLWNTAGDPGAVLRLVRLSALGWAALGPLALHLFLEVAQDPAPRTRRLLPFLYAASAGFAALAQTTDWIHSGGVTRHAWGWSYDLAPTYLVFYAFTVGCIALAVRVLYRAFRGSASPPEREQMVLLLVGLAVPLSVASATDGLLPVAGIQPPRLGTAAFAVLNALIAWTFYRYTYPLVAPGLSGKVILENLRDGVALLRPDGRIRTANESLARLAGCPRGGLGERQARELLPELPDDPHGEVREREVELVSLSGRRIPVSVSTVVIWDRHAQVVGVLLVVRDLREMVELRNRLVTSGRLAAVGELAAGIAHEINNPIAYARANLAQLRERWEELAKRLEQAGDRSARGLLDDGAEMIEESLEGVDRAAAIVRDVKGFSHAGHSQREMVDVNRLLESVLRVAAPQLRYRANVETTFREVRLVPGAPQELKQVFLNLLLNANQAIGEGGSIRIASVEVGGDVCVLVEDDGCGMGAELLARIFDPFFTTKAVGEGTGLGLAISYEIVRSHGGEIGVESEPGRGTIFRVRLPGAAAEDESG